MQIRKMERKEAFLDWVCQISKALYPHSLLPPQQLWSYGELSPSWTISEMRKRDED